MQTHVVYECTDFLILEKPHGVKSAPLRCGEADTALSYAIEQCPQIKKIHGKKDLEYGLLHRLDTATHGLLLISKSQQNYDYVTEMQNQLKFKKEYMAICSCGANDSLPKAESTVVSYFRPFGPHGMQVRPVTCAEHQGRAEHKKAGTTLYTTQIISAVRLSETRCKIHCSLCKGYRHQVRTHLAMIGFSIVGDTLYNNEFTHIEDSILDLHAVALEFPYPSITEKFRFELRNFFTSANK